MKKEVLKASKKGLIYILCFARTKSLRLRTRLVDSIERSLKFSKLKVIFQSPCKLNSVFRYKKFYSNVVDKYTCSNYKTTFIVKRIATYLLEFTYLLWLFLV